MLELTSSVIRTVDYDPVSGTFDVLFVSGRRYTYFGVSAWKYDELIVASSAGEYFNAEIRDQYSVVER